MKERQHRRGPTRRRETMNKSTWEVDGIAANLNRPGASLFRQRPHEMNGRDAALPTVLCVIVRDFCSSCRQRTAAHDWRDFGRVKVVPSRTEWELGKKKGQPRTSITITRTTWPPRETRRTQLERKTVWGETDRLKGREKKIRKKINRKMFDVAAAVHILIRMTRR